MMLYLFRQAGTTNQKWVAVNSKFWLFLRVIIHRQVCKEVESKFVYVECVAISSVYSRQQ